jgi:SAM-dependent methyltransferase
MTYSRDRYLEGHNLHNKDAKFNYELETKFNKRFNKYGANPKGSYWLNAERQNLRFEIMFKEIIKLGTKKAFSVGDIGCGYGALLQFIMEKYSNDKIHYYGYDISKELIDYCRKNYCQTGATFSVGSKPQKSLDFCLISGTFNLSATKIYSDWENYIFRNLTSCWQQTQTALIFNLQTCNKPYISHGNIFYGNKHAIARRCGVLFGPTSFTSHSQLPHDTTFVIKRIYTK